MSATPASGAPFGRVLTAMVTPFATGGSVDLDAVQRVAVHLVDNGNDGVVVSGTTGESPTTSDAEKDQILRAVVEAVGDRATVVAGVGTNNTAHSIELARSAEKAGADGLLVVTPYYNKPPQAGLLAHFASIADATGVPSMLYDIPSRSSVPIHTDTLRRLSEHERIVAVKDAKADLWETSKVLASTDLAYYSGIDELNLPLLTLGAVGVVSVVGHVTGRQYAAMVRAVDNGDLATAREIHSRLIPLVESIMTITQGAIAVKAALEALGVLANRTVRPPLVEATEDEIEAVRTALVAVAIQEDAGHEGAGHEDAAHEQTERTTA